MTLAVNTQIDNMSLITSLIIYAIMRKNILSGANSITKCFKNRNGSNPLEKNLKKSRKKI